jgi:tellurite methyltransferase
MAEPILDTRPFADFVAARAHDAVNIPVEELAARVHELPVGGTAVTVFDVDPARVRRAETFLAERGHPVSVLPVESVKLTAAGRSAARLWQPSPFLVEVLPLIARRGRALDVACGTGRDAVFLGLSGFDVEATDLLPDATAKAVDLASRYGVSLRTWEQDVEREPTLPVGAYDLVTVFRFLHRPLFAALAGALKPGGHLVYETFHERTAETGRSPRSPQHLLKSGELGAAFAGLEILLQRDAVPRDGRYVSQLLARRR